MYSSCVYIMIYGRPDLTVSMLKTTVRVCYFILITLNSSLSDPPKKKCNCGLENLNVYHHSFESILNQYFQILNIETFLLIEKKVAFPWVVHIHIDDKHPLQGGVLVTDKHVLTIYDDELMKANFVKVIYVTEKVDPDDPKSIPSDAKTVKVLHRETSVFFHKAEQLLILTLGKA